MTIENGPCAYIREIESMIEDLLDYEAVEKGMEDIAAGRVKSWEQAKRELGLDGQPDIPD